ncbi:MAG: septal ring lytic transglycosylase RlpA family protein [Chthoniobacterales bacterium]
MSYVILKKLLGTFSLLGVVAVLSACSSSGYSGYKYKPYTINGRHYYPMQPEYAVGYVEEGVASHYAEHKLFFIPGKTAIGEKMWAWSKNAAHKTLPLPCLIRVTNLQNGRSTKVRVNDRGPFIDGRNLDVSASVAKKLRFYDQGLVPVRVEVLSVGDGRYRIR